jgi:hypothetical protein
LPKTDEKKLQTELIFKYLRRKELGWPVDAYGALLKLEARDSYKIIYISQSPLESLGRCISGPRTCQNISLAFSPILIVAA